MCGWNVFFRRREDSRVHGCVLVGDLPKCRRVPVHRLQRWNLPVVVRNKHLWRVRRWDILKRRGKCLRQLHRRDIQHGSGCVGLQVLHQWHLRRRLGKNDELHRHMRAWNLFEFRRFRLRRMLGRDVHMVLRRAQMRPMPSWDILLGGFRVHEL